MICNVCYKYVKSCYEQIIFLTATFVNTYEGIHKLLIIQAKAAKNVAKMRRSPAESAAHVYITYFNCNIL